MASPPAENICGITIRAVPRKYASAIIVGVIGLAIMGTAVLAARLGIDPSPGWGRGRIALLILGACVVLAAVVYGRYQVQISSWLSKWWSRLLDLPIIRSIRQNETLVYLLGLVPRYRIAIPIAIVVLLIYIWFVSAGTWTTWTSPTHLYADLARGFLRGNLYLAMKVDPNTLKSPDPYDPSNGLQGYLDVSLFNGKYYLYWGPVPALILVLLHPVISWRLGDMQVLFGFLAGLWLLQCLLVVVIWDRLFSQLPKYQLVMALLLVGLANPVAYMLDYTRSARIYEAAIVGGQFFLFGGLIAAFTALGPPLRPWRLALAGTLWALAVGTRLILAVPVGLMVLMVAWWVQRADQRPLKKIADLIALVLPLAVGAAWLGWYNWARFGSVTETGYFYQLTYMPQWQQNFARLFAPIFIPQNLYNYLLFPFSIQPQFPYLYAVYARMQPIFPAYALPSFYFAGKITGLVWTLPFAAFALIALAASFSWLRNRKVDADLAGADQARALNWLTLTLFGTFLVTFGTLLTFFWAVMRYMEEVVPALAILAVIGFWRGYVWIIDRPRWKVAYVAVGILLAVASIGVSTLVGISVNNARLPIVALLTSAK